MQIQKLRTWRSRDAAGAAAAAALPVLKMPLPVISFNLGAEPVLLERSEQQQQQP